MNTQGQEIGYQFLDTTFTGVSNPSLSGFNDPELPIDIIIPSDMGTSAPLDHFELKSYF